MKTFKTFLPLLIMTCFLITTACNQQGRGFALPAGDAQLGKTTFVKHNCNSCHTISDIEFTGNEEDLLVPLGGTVSRMKTYGELVTSVINPSHKVEKEYREDIGVRRSKMKLYNEVMTVQDLTDIVTFLQSEYDIETPSDYYYPY